MRHLGWGGSDGAGVRAPNSLAGAGALGEAVDKELRVGVTQHPMQHPAVDLVDEDRISFVQDAARRSR